MFQGEALAALSALAEWLPRCVYLAVVAYTAYSIVTIYVGVLYTYDKLLDFNAPDYREFVRKQKEMWDSRSTSGGSGAAAAS